MRLAVVGPPEADLSLYPAVCNAAFRAMGIPGEVVPISLEKESFDPCIRHLQEIKFRGAAVAHPYKVDAARIAERFWIARFALGVANTLLFEGGSIFAQNTEVPAIMEALKGIEPGRALIMGTGHAARSVVAALLQAGWQTRVWNRNANKSKVLMTLLQRYGTIELAHEPDPSGCKLIVNATPLGAKPGEIPPVIWNRVLPKTTFCDLVFRKIPTEMLRTASVRGLKTIDGRELFVEQCAIALEWWSGKQVPRAPMNAAAGIKTPTWTTAL